MRETFKPFAYQQKAIDFLIDRTSAALWLDMGLGKTVVALTALDELIYNQCLGCKCLIVAPLRVAETTWTSEADKWEHLKHLRVQRIIGIEKQRVKAVETEADIYTIGFANLAWLIKKYARKWKFDIIILDEASAFKNPSSVRFRALKAVRPKVKRLFELTGTPAPNGLLDVWSQVYLLDGGQRLGKTITEYRNNYFVPDARNAQIVFSYKTRPFAEEVIYKKLEDICLSMKSSDYLELPELINNIVQVELDKSEMNMYNQFERDFLLNVNETVLTASTAAVLTGKLLQFSNGAVYDENKKVIEIHDKKIQALGEIVENCNGNVLVFYQFKHDLERLKKAFPNAKVFDGEECLTAWNEGKIKMLLCHPASVGYGLNMQAGGNTIVWFGLTWSLELYQQSVKRLHRQGQDKPVVVHHIVAKGCYDENIIPSLGTKADCQDRLLETLKAKIKTVKEQQE